MAIEFDCPHCGHHYRLKDELAGKAAACKNCRNKILIPSPVTVPDDTPLPAPSVDVEAAAVAALSDTPKVAEDPSKQVIEVECKFCSHKWTEPLSRAGKNTLCPNPECRQRVKIPEPKPDQILDWRQTQTKGPSLAKDNQLQKLEGVQDAADVKQVSGTALKEADATGEELEPRPLKQKVMFVLLAVGLVAGLVFGVKYLLSSRTESKEDRLMQNSQEEFARSDFAKGNEKAPKDVKEEIAVFTAVMQTAGGEHSLRHNHPDKLKEAMKQFAEAQGMLRPVNSFARNAMVAELAVAMLALGGTEEQARNQHRIRWTPELNLKTRPNEQLFTVFEELRKVLGLLQSGDLEFRMHLARRLTHELVRRGQPGVAADLLPLALFGQQSEQYEAKAVVALELHRAKVPDLPAKLAAELAKVGPELAKATPRPASAQTLFAVLNIEKAPLVVNSLPPAGPVPTDTRFAYTGLAILQGKPDEALALAQRPGRPEERLRSLVLCADWLADPTAALDAANGIVAARNPKDKLSPYALLRLTQIAAAAGKHDLANRFADALPDDSAKAWAKGDALRLRLAAAPNEKGEETWMELPDKPEKYRAGHAWGRLWLARHNTRVSGGNRNEQVKVVSGWPAPFDLFGKAGVALGLQDK